jgi:hypothetical protein
MFKNKKNTTSIGLRGLFRRRTKEEGDGSDNKKEAGGADTTISSTKTEVTVDSHRGIDLEAFDAALEHLPNHSTIGGILSILSSTGLNDDSTHELGIRSMYSSRRTRSESALDDYSEGDKYFVRSEVSSTASTAAVPQWVSNVPQQDAATIRAAADSDDDESLGSVELLLYHMCGSSTRDDVSVSEEQIQQPKPKKRSIILSMMNGMCGS